MKTKNSMRKKGTKLKSKGNELINKIIYFGKRHSKNTGLKKKFVGLQNNSKRLNKINNVQKTNKPMMMSESYLTSK